MLPLKAVEFANSINPDEVAHNGLPHMDLHCWPTLNSEYNVALVKYVFFSNFAGINFDICFFTALIVEIDESFTEAAKQIEQKGNVRGIYSRTSVA